MQTAATVRTIILDRGGRMLIVRRSQTDPLYPGTWDIPGGQVEPGEEVVAAAMREAKEEVGLRLSNLQLLFATSDMRGDVSKTWLFYAQQVSPDMPVVLGDEHDELKWISPQLLGDYTDYEILLRFRDYAVANKLFDPKP
jgi:8-oxo-dGTP diphosphatase